MCNGRRDSCSCRKTVSVDTSKDNRAFTTGFSSPPTTIRQPSRRRLPSRQNDWREFSWNVCPTNKYCDGMTARRRLYSLTQVADLYGNRRAVAPYRRSSASSEAGTISCASFSNLDEPEVVQDEPDPETVQLSLVREVVALLARYESSKKLTKKQ